MNKCEVKNMYNKFLEIQRNIDKIRKSSAVPVCEENEKEQKQMFQKLLNQYHEKVK